LVWVDWTPYNKLHSKIINEKQSRYSDDILQTQALLPVLKQLTTLAWQQSKIQHGFKRWHFFFTALIYATLTRSACESATEQPLNKVL
jgi:hypothetical protein